MMRLSVQRVIVSLTLCIVSLGVLAQEKTLQYYNTHESEIMPDAQAAFRKGDYERTIELCRWHYIIFGDNTADILRRKSEQCAQLTKEMNALRANGNLQEAKLKASAILAINPDDAAAKAISMLEIPSSQVPDTAEVKPPVEAVDTVVTVPTEEIRTEEDEDAGTDSIETQIEEIQDTPVPDASNQPSKPTQQDAASKLKNKKISAFVEFGPYGFGPTTHISSKNGETYWVKGGVKDLAASVGLYLNSNLFLGVGGGLSSFSDQRLISYQGFVDAKFSIPVVSMAGLFVGIKAGIAYGTPDFGDGMFIGWDTGFKLNVLGDLALYLGVKGSVMTFTNQEKTEGVTLLPFIGISF